MAVRGRRRLKWPLYRRRCPRGRRPRTRGRTDWCGRPMLYPEIFSMTSCRAGRGARHAHPSSGGSARGTAVAVPTSDWRCLPRRYRRVAAQARDTDNPTADPHLRPGRQSGRRRGHFGRLADVIFALHGEPGTWLVGSRRKRRPYRRPHSRSRPRPRRCSRYLASSCTARAHRPPRFQIFGRAGQDRCDVVTSLILAALLPRCRPAARRPTTHRYFTYQWFSLPTPIGRRAAVAYSSPQPPRGVARSAASFQFDCSTASVRPGNSR